jgi:hypothetical protein
MAEILLKQEDGTYVAIPLKVEVRGIGTVTNQTDTAEEESSDG